MAGKYDVYVIQDGDEYYVRPGVVIVDGGPGGKVRVRNLTGLPIELEFPAAVAAAGRVPIAARAAAHVPLAPGADGLYEFAVDVTLREGVTKRALGHSWPKIIVDP